MNKSGLVLLFLSWGLILGLLIFCFCRVFLKREIK